jgi:hypothetical protein
MRDLDVHTMTVGYEYTFDRCGEYLVLRGDGRAAAYRPGKNALEVVGSRVIEFGDRVIDVRTGGDVLVLDRSGWLLRLTEHERLPVANLWIGGPDFLQVASCTVIHQAWMAREWYNFVAVWFSGALEPELFSVQGISGSLMNRSSRFRPTGRECLSHRSLRASVVRWACPRESDPMR